MNPFRPFIAALCWLIRVEPEPLTAAERKLLDFCCRPECMLCPTQPAEVKVTIGECPGEGNRVDDAAKLLDNGWVILLFRRQLGSYTARAIRPFHLEADMQYDDTKTDVVTTTNFTISKALYRLTEKVTTGRIVGPQ